MIKWLAWLIEPGNEWVAPRTSRAVQLAARLLSTSSLCHHAEAGTGAEWPEPRAKKSEIKVRTGTRERRERLKRRNCVWVLVCVCERERDVPHSARGQWELIFLLSYPLASLAVLAVRWWIHCFLKFVCNHRLYALLSYLLGPCSLFFSSLFHRPHSLFFSFISPSPSLLLLFFFFFLLHLNPFHFCVFLLLLCCNMRSFKGKVSSNNQWLFAYYVCVCFVHVCAMSIYLMLLVCGQPLFLSFPPSHSLFQVPDLSIHFFLLLHSVTFRTRLAPKMLC